MSRTSRRELERQPNIAGQRPPKELLASFRVLWAMVLRAHGWPAWAVASIMGLPGTTAAAQRLGAQLRLGMRHIKALASLYAVKWWPELRHTFGVHAARAGVPLVRLQKLMGRATPSVTMRYMRHAPDGDFAADAALVAGSIAGDRQREEQSRAELVRQRVLLA